MNKADEGERSRALEILHDVGLPETLAINIGVLSPGIDAAYDPAADTLVLRKGAPTLAILREGARAEYYRHANLVKSVPDDAHARFGLMLASEAYVGIRLASMTGFVESESEALRIGRTSTCPATLGEWAAGHENAAEIGRTPSDRTPLGMLVASGLLRALRVVVAERKNGEVAFGADLEKSVPGMGDALRSIVAATAQLARKEERLIDLDRLRALGKNSTEKLATIK